MQEIAELNWSIKVGNKIIVKRIWLIIKYSEFKENIIWWISWISLKWNGE